MSGTIRTEAPLEALCRLGAGGPDGPLGAAALADHLCTYLGSRELAGRDLGGYVDRLNGIASGTYTSVDRASERARAAYGRGDESMLQLLVEFLPWPTHWSRARRSGPPSPPSSTRCSGHRRHRPQSSSVPRDRRRRPPRRHAARRRPGPPTPGRAPHPGQGELPLGGDVAGPAPAPTSDPIAAAPCKVRKARDLTGKLVRYRSDRGVVLIRVASCDAATVAGTDEDGAPWSNVSRERVKVVKEGGAGGPEAAAVDPDPPLVLAIPAAAVAFYAPILAARGGLGGVVPGVAPGDAAASWAVADGDNQVNVEVANADHAPPADGERGAFVDVYVAEGGALACARPGSSTLLGTRTLRFGGRDRVLRVVEG